MSAILIAGLGSIARKHIAAIRSLRGDDAPVYALRSRRDAPHEEGVVDIYTIDEARALDPEFAVVSTPTSLHAGLLRSLADTRIPLMIEKPLFERAAYPELVDRLGDRLTYVACNLRFLDALRFVKERVDAGTLPSAVNEVNVYCGSSLPSWRPGSDWRICYSARPEMGGGVHLDLIHELDYLCWIFGQPLSSRGICRSASSLGIRAVDYANYCLVYPQFAASVVLNYYRTDYRRTMEIVMADDTWTVDLAANRITDASGRTVFESSRRVADTYRDQMAYFMKLVAQGARRSMNDIAFANEILKITTDYEGFER